MPSPSASSRTPESLSEQFPIVTALRETGALQTGHFSLSSGLHSDQYVQCARLTEHPRHAAAAAEQLAQHIDTTCDVVVGPALGGIVIAHELARALDVRCQFAERPADGGAHVFRRGFALESGERVIVAEDVITTGASALAVARLVETTGAHVVGIACIVDRRISHVPDLDGRPLHRLLELTVPTYTADNCPLCTAGLTIDHPGSSPRAESVIHRM